MLRFGIIGTGRIGDMHARLVALQPDATVTCCFDVFEDSAKATAAAVGARATTDIDALLGADDVDAVLIASPTNTHVEMILRSAEAGKPILCEKPIDVDINKVEECKEKLKAFDVPLQLGFNRRFDPSHAGVQQAVARGDVGALELLVITSRDPGPPPPRAILEACGGLFRDTTIHDMDMARFVMGEDPVEVFTMAANRVDPIFAELNDVDTAMIVMRGASGALCHINNSRRTNYGYDQRVEAFGAEGMVRSNNHRPSEVSRYGSGGTATRDELLYFFIERYRAAYEAEIRDFIDQLTAGKPPNVTFEDGRRALLLSEAALKSYETNKPVEVDYA
ncbi:inositol 2-dehydrogenase [Aestuariicoccus sp. MJ-SS9]|uniref:inositol 2-dehydrogenase n=1 Tax=Aestuariicoccus sp. MJ-SS9 TaxID=3079855 RepID=UPI00290D9ED2|nr:inositol 2-dehydrogenase [Aestuariicoccus sp. MJ-SS9]MDU8913947.1 inositol 2-dehydrogenase [Aestuariicoccus sp. MJ-SS9]